MARKEEEFLVQRAPALPVAPWPNQPSPVYDDG